MRIALIGYGYWGKIIFKYLENHKYFKLAKVFDIKENKNNCIFTNDIYEIMNDSSIKAIYIATPVSTHFEIIKLAVETQKFIFCEKILVSRKEEIEFIKKNFSDKIIETNYIYTDSPSINYIKENIKRIGEIKHIEGEIKQFGNFYFDSDVYSTIGCHLLSSIMYIFNTNEIEIFSKDIIKSNEISIKGIMEGKVRKKIPFNLNVDLLSDTKKRNIVLYGSEGIIYFNPLNSEYTLKIRKINQMEKNTYFDENIKFNENDNINLALQRFKKVVEKERNTNLNMAIKISEELFKISEEK